AFCSGQGNGERVQEVLFRFIVTPLDPKFGVGDSAQRLNFEGVKANVLISGANRIVRAEMPCAGNFSVAHELNPGLIDFDRVRDALKWLPVLPKIRGPVIDSRPLTADENA